jgi:hypothetical protein
MDKVVDNWWIRCFGCGNNIFPEDLKEGLARKRVIYKHEGELPVYLHNIGYCLEKSREDRFKKD